MHRATAAPSGPARCGARAKQARGQSVQIRGASVERLEYAQRDSREHGLRAAECVDQFQHRSGIGSAHRAPLKWSYPLRRQELTRQVNGAWTSVAHYADAC